MRREIGAFALGFAAGIFTLAVVLWATGNFRRPPAAVLVGQPATVHAEIMDTVRGTPPPRVVVPVPAPVPIMGKTALEMPIEGLDPATLPGTFSQKRGDRPHEALDIMAPRGTPVHAVVQGNVVKLFSSKQGGLTVYQFDDVRELCYYYAHLDRYAVGLKEGTLLRRGDVLGYVGSTGNASPDAPHLHFAIFELGPEKEWWKGKPIDPLPRLQGR
jgi:murein DD-endopeptidase MepM/ murein hydrolase activator NlpD